MAFQICTYQHKVNKEHEHRERHDRSKYQNKPQETNPKETEVCGAPDKEFKITI